MQASSERSRAGRPTSTQAAHLTERLRRAAFETFLENGYDGATMEAVAQAAGITKSTLYSRYPDKRSLFIAVSSWALTRHERDEQVLEPLPDDLAEALLVIARAVLARSVDPDLVRLNRMAIAESSRFPEFAANSQAVTWTPRIRMLMDLLRRHERAGTVALADAELAAEQFFAMVGAMPAWLAAYGMQRSPEVETQHLKHAVGLFLSGVLVREPRSLPAAGPFDPVKPAEPVEPVALVEPVAPVRSVLGGSAPPAALTEYRPLGRSGLRVARLALGTAAFGAGCDQPTATGLVRRYLDGGGNLIDIDGTDEVATQLCAQALRGRRSQAVLVVRSGRRPGSAGPEAANSRREIRAACEASLRRLGTDHLDLYQVDLQHADTPLEETIDALDALVRAGKVLYVGAAHGRAYRLMKALSASDRLGRARFVSLRARYDLAARGLEREHLPLLAEEGLGLLAVPRPGLESMSGTLGDSLRRAATDLRCTPAQLHLAWLAGGPAASVIVEPRTVADLEESLAAPGIEIPPALAAQLELEASGPSGPSGPSPTAAGDRPHRPSAPPTKERT